MKNNCIKCNKEPARLFGYCVRCFPVGCYEGAKRKMKKKKETLEEVVKSKGMEKRMSCSKYDLHLNLYKAMIMVPAKGECDKGDLYGCINCGDFFRVTAGVMNIAYDVNRGLNHILEYTMKPGYFELAIEEARKNVED